MSTEYNLLCLSHDPPVVSDSVDGWLATNSWGLGQLRAHVADRERVARLYRETEGEWPPMDERDRHWTARFLAMHPNCTLGIIDEYSRTHPLEEPHDDAR